MASFPCLWSCERKGQVTDEKTKKKKEKKRKREEAEAEASGAKEDEKPTDEGKTEAEKNHESSNQLFYRLVDNAPRKHF